MNKKIMNKKIMNKKIMIILTVSLNCFFVIIEFLQIFSNVNLIILLVGFLSFSLLLYNLYFFVKSVYMKGIEMLLLKYNYIFYINKVILKNKVNIYINIENYYYIFILFFFKLKNFINIIKKSLMNEVFISNTFLNLFTMIKNKVDLNKLNMFVTKGANLKNIVGFFIC
jgi:hypothetical protein